MLCRILLAVYLMFLSIFNDNKWRKVMSREFILSKLKCDTHHTCILSTKMQPKMGQSNCLTCKVSWVAVNKYLLCLYHFPAMQNLPNDPNSAEIKEHRWVWSQSDRICGRGRIHQRLQRKHCSTPTSSQDICCSSRTQHALHGPIGEYTVTAMV